MKWSKYNFLYARNNTEYYLYNSRTNSLIHINKDMYDLFKGMESNEIEIRKDIDHYADLLKRKIIVEPYEDDGYITQSKYINYLKNFNSQSLGLVIAPTTACNFKCPYCYEHNLPFNKMDRHTESHIVSFIKSFKDVKYIALCWHGGEPLLAFDNIKNILLKCKQNDITINSHAMVTNGYLLNEEVCHFFKKSFPINHIQITIDGDRESHNLSRLSKMGQPTYDTIIANVDTAVDLLPETHITIRTNIHKNNMGSISELYKNLSKRWANKNVSISLAYTVSNEKCNVPCMKNREQLQFAIDLLEKYKLNIVNFYPKAHNCLTCTAVFNNAFVIGPDGELYKCWTDLGKKDKTIGSIFNKSLNLNLMAEYVIGTDKFSDTKCLNCKLFPVCDGGCGIYRLENKIHNTEYNNCPIESDDIYKIFNLIIDHNINGCEVVDNFSEKA